MEYSDIVTSFTNFAKKHWLPLFVGILGLICLGYGMIQLSSQNAHPQQQTDFQQQQVIRPTVADNALTVDVEGAVSNPGVYHLSTGSRVKDAIDKAGGLSETADSDYVSQHINLAAKITDGGKIYIPQPGEEVNTSSSTDNTSDGVLGDATGLININTASSDQLDSLPGIGPVTAEKIINGREYSDVQDLLTKKVVTQKVFDKIKDQITVN